MNIELKSSSESAIAKFISLINRYDRRDITIIGVRNPNYKKLSFYDSKTIRFCSDRQIMLITLAYFLGVLSFLPIKQHALQIPLYTTHFYEWKKREWKN
jgi:hypothetical protein